VRGLFSDALERTKRSLESLKNNARFEPRNELLSELGRLNSDGPLADLQMSQKDLNGIAESTDVLEKLSGQSVAAAAESREQVAYVAAAPKPIIDRIAQTNAAIAELKELSGEAGNSVGVIADSADQTKLLALNAAIEAARAGEQGRRPVPRRPARLPPGGRTAGRGAQPPAPGDGSGFRRPGVRSRPADSHHGTIQGRRDSERVGVRPPRPDDRRAAHGPTCVP